MTIKNPSRRKNRRVAFTLAMIAALVLFSGALAAGEILDPNFGTNGVVTTTLTGINDRANHVILQPDGRILVSGLYQTSTPFVARYSAAGVLDAAFGNKGILLPQITGFSGSTIAVQADGKLLLAGSNNGKLVVARYNSTGTILDTTFGTNGVVQVGDSGGFSRYGLTDLAIQADQRIVVVGTETNQGNFTNIVVARFKTNGALDTTFVSNGIIILDKTNFPNNRYNNGKAVAIQADGKIVVSGDMLDDDAVDQISLVRLNPDGSLDTDGFGTNGQGTVMAPFDNFKNTNGALALQSDGQIVVAGSTLDTPNEDLALARFNADGSLDDTFGGTGTVQTDFGNNENASDMAIQSDGKIILAGKIYGPSFSNILLVRYNSDGSLDSTFGTGGKITTDFANLPDSGNGLALQANGLIVLAGSSNGKALLARYIPDVSNRTVFNATFKSTGGHDGWVLESGENSNVGGSFNSVATTFNLGDDQKDKQYRGFLSFNTGTLPDSSVVTSAHVDIIAQGVFGINPFTTYGDLLMDLRTGTWSNNLALQLADFNAAGTAGTTQEHFVPLAFNSYTAQFSSGNLRFINNYGFTQLRLLFTKDDNDNLKSDYVKIFSGNSDDVNRPVLVITYFVP